jgi:hypothetical protein
MALYMAVVMGGTPIGAPIVGAVANHLGPRWALGVAAVAAGVAALIGLAWLVIARGLRVVRHPTARWMPALAYADAPTAAIAVLPTMPVAVVGTTPAEHRRDPAVAPGHVTCDAATKSVRTEAAPAQ